MARIAIQNYLRKFLRERNSVRAFGSNVYQKTMSTQVSVEQKEVNDNSKHSINPMEHPDFFQVHNLFTIKDLFNGMVHYGHKEGTLHENMRSFIFGSRLGHLIIDLNQTAELLRQALNFTAHIALHGGLILFISKNPSSTCIIEKTALNCQEYALTRSWKSGIFTDSVKIFRLETRLPDLCIFIHTLDNVVTPHPAIIEAAKMCIPTVGIVDTNCNPNLITYPVPGNDDTPCAIELYCNLFCEAILRGKNARKLMLKKLESVKK
ncbi:28S ribosomal protein S2, mitochondrial [Vespa crabro]|uniref:28S ribosomal protein S2, mitochondrial n=1 Tax=Vespa crabro TaxID=7445 RepID=UPI001EFF9F00|nr:28S ribosomal protein S2, mitochondrial [Vespa crabro]